MNHRAQKKTSEVARGEAVERTGGCSIAQGSSVEGAIKAINR